MYINLTLCFIGLTIAIYGIFRFIYAIYKNIIENEKLSNIEKNLALFFIPAIIAVILTAKYYDSL